MSEINTKQQEIDRNLEYFKDNLPELLKSHLGKYALIRHQEIIGFYDTVIDAQMTGARFFKDGIFSVQRWLRLSEQIFRVDKWSICRG